MEKTENVKGEKMDQKQTEKVDQQTEMWVVTLLDVCDMCKGCTHNKVTKVYGPYSSQKIACRIENLLRNKIRREYDAEDACTLLVRSNKVRPFKQYSGGPIEPSKETLQESSSDDD